MIERHIHKLVEDSLNLFPVVLINGARQVGKSTLAQQVKKNGLLKTYTTLDDLTILQAAHRDPEGFISQFKEKVAIDEIQRVPDLLLPIKKAVDLNKEPGQFLLTGSANILSHPKVKESLAGRMDIIELEGLSYRESHGKVPSSFLEHLFSKKSLRDMIHDLEEEPKEKLSKKDLNECIFFGNFPDIILKKNITFSQKWFTAYQKSYIEKDVRDLSKNTDIINFAQTIKFISYQTAQLLNYNNLAVNLGLDKRTVTRYLEILEMTFQTSRLYPWHKNARKRYVKMPRIYFTDSGMACHYIGTSSPDDLNGHALYGNLLETWVWSEIRKMISVFPSPIQTYFYRTYQGKEVDFVLESKDRIWGIEVKRSSTITSKDLQGLKDFQQAVGDNAKGALLYFGDKIVGFDDRLLAIPISYIL